MGKKIPVLIGNIRYRDHQLWPTVDPTVFAAVRTRGVTPIAAVEWNASLTLAQLMAVTWRVRAWELTGQWSAASTDGTNTKSAVVTLLNTPVTAGWLWVENDFATYHGPITDEIDKMREAFSPVDHTTPLYMNDVGIITGNHMPLHDFALVPNITPPNPTVPFPTITMHGAFVFNGAPSATDESNIFLKFMRDFDASSNPFYTWQNQGADMIEFFDDADPTLIRFSPRISCTANAVFATNNQFFLGPSNSPNANIVIDPVVSAPFNLPVQIGDPNIIYSLTSHACTLKLTATAFFPFSDSQGNPVYDATTGAQLNDPLG